MKASPRRISIEAYEERDYNNRPEPRQKELSTGFQELQDLDCIKERAFSFSPGFSPVQLAHRKERNRFHGFSQPSPIKENR